LENNKNADEVAYCIYNRVFHAGGDVAGLLQLFFGEFSTYFATSYQFYT